MSHEGLEDLRSPAGPRGPGQAGIIPEALGGAPNVPGGVSSAAGILGEIDVPLLLTLLPGVLRIPRVGGPDATARNPGAANEPQQ
eukprot:9550972-Alexandrium_andersonii.AAC.1